MKSSNQTKKKKEWNKQIITWENIQKTNIHTMGVLEEKGEKRDRELIWRNNGRKLPKSEKRNGHGNSSSKNSNQVKSNKFKETTQRHITIKLPKVKIKERTLRTSREKQLLAQEGTSLRLSVDFSAEIWKAKRVVWYIPSTKEKKKKSRIL